MRGHNKFSEARDYLLDTLDDYAEAYTQCGQSDNREGARANFHQRRIDIEKIEGGLNRICKKIREFGCV